MSAYEINIDPNQTPEQETFMSFQCSVQSVPITNNNDNISFKIQVVEYNGKTQTEIPITCISSIYNVRMFSKINKLQKGNRIEIVGDLIKNEEEEIVVSVIYFVYANTNNFSTFDKNDLTKIPWLDSNNLTKMILMKINHKDHIIVITCQILLPKIDKKKLKKIKILIQMMRMLLK